jgi:energy-coupling factor transport system substrate-specific component
LRELFQMWRHTRMVVLTAVSAALFAAVLIPFKIFPLIPGVTEVRPANALPIVFSFLFGPAGAWGAAMGNLIGDTFGTLGPGTLFGILGNLLYGFLPYRMWAAWSRSDPVPLRSARWWSLFIAVIVTASACCALVIGWGLHILGFVPFPYLSTTIFLNNVVVSLAISPFLLRSLFHRVRGRGLLYQDLLDGRDLRTGLMPRTGTVLVFIGGVGGLILGNYLALANPMGAEGAAGPVGWGVVPALGLMVLGCVLL